MECSRLLDRRESRAKARPQRQAEQGCKSDTDDYGTATSHSTHSFPVNYLPPSPYRTITAGECLPPCTSSPFLHAEATVVPLPARLQPAPSTEYRLLIAALLPLGLLAILPASSVKWCSEGAYRRDFCTRTILLGKSMILFVLWGAVAVGANGAPGSGTAGDKSIASDRTALSIEVKPLVPAPSEPSR